MKIAFLSSMHPALDKRVFAKEAVTLANAGHDVVHLSPSDKNLEWCQGGVRLVTYRPRSSHRLSRLPSLYRMARALDVDAYHCNEVDSWLVGVLLKFSTRRRLIFDVHEHYPSDFAERRFPRWLQPLIAFAVRVLFACLTPFTDRLVMAKKAIDRDFPASPQRKILVENFADLAYSSVEATRPRSLASRDKVIAIHIGEMGLVRGWPQLLDAIRLLNDDRLLVELAGRFGDGSGELFTREVTESALGDRLRVLDWMPFVEVYQRLLSADIGLILFQPGLLNHVLALPHKMFDYMMAGIPVIAPRFAVEVAEIVRDADCGLLIDPSSSEEIASALRRLMDDPSERRRLGQNGRQAVLQKYNWDVEGRKLVSMYAELAGVPS